MSYHIVYRDADQNVCSATVEDASIARQMARTDAYIVVTSEGRYAYPTYTATEQDELVAVLLRNGRAIPRLACLLPIDKLLSQEVGS